MKLFAGPYDYEFGHELFSFQGYIRKLSRDHGETVVCSKACMEFLYKDFVNEFVPLGDPDNRPQLGDAYKKVTMEDCRKSVARNVGNFKHEQEFIKYGKPIDQRYDIIVHARTKKGKMSINLDEEDYKILLNVLSEDYKVAFIGSKDGAYSPDGAEDLRGVPLERLANIMYSSRLVVGQSSGPIHFSSLCTVPHLTWGGYRLRTFARYSYYWNPFKTLCYLLESPDGYLKNRLRKARLPKNILNEGHFNTVECENYRQPPVKELVLNIRDILESDKLNGYNEKRMLRDNA